MKTAKKPSIDNKIRMQREANRQALINQAARITKGATIPFLKEIHLNTNGDGKVTYHSADNDYVYGNDEYGCEVKIAHASNSFYSQLIHRITKAVANAVDNEL